MPVTTDPTTRALLALLAILDREDRLVLRDLYGYRVAADEPWQAALTPWREAGYPGASEPIEPASDDDVAAAAAFVMGGPAAGPYSDEALASAGLPALDDGAAWLRSRVESEPEPVAPSKRLVWVRVKDAWHLCRHDVPDWLTGPYSAWPDSAVAYAGHGAAVGRDEPCASTAESAALCEAWAKEDGFKPDPWPGEAP